MWTCGPSFKKFTVDCADRSEPRLLTWVLKVKRQNGEMWRPHRVNTLNMKLEMGDSQLSLAQKLETGGNICAYCPKVKPSITSWKADECVSPKYSSHQHKTLHTTQTYKDIEIYHCSYLGHIGYLHGIEWSKDRTRYTHDKVSKLA